MIVPATQWWDAEEYHQLYLSKNLPGYQCPNTEQLIPKFAIAMDIEFVNTLPIYDNRICEAGTDGMLENTIAEGRYKEI